MLRLAGLISAAALVKLSFKPVISSTQQVTPLVTFQEQWDVTRKTYTVATIPKDISFEEAEETLKKVVIFWESNQIVPFSFPLPERTEG